jgi:ABC-type sugar transport system ATPase subunit
MVRLLATEETGKIPDRLRSSGTRLSEIVGIYGLMGAGRTELFECLLGSQRNYLGKLWLDGKTVRQPPPQAGDGEVTRHRGNRKNP